MIAPIVLFVYNRPEHTRRTVEALKGNVLADCSNLFVYSDAPRTVSAESSVRDVRTYIRDITGFASVTIIERKENWGVDPSIIDGVTTLCERYGRVIVLEDDLVTSRWFLKYMNQGLDLYSDEERVMQISGFMFPIEKFDAAEACFLPYATCWGWATWKRAWAQFDASASGYEILKNDRRKRRAFDLNGAYDYFDLLEHYAQGKTDAWDIRWYLSVFMKDGLALFPRKSLVDNIGLDGSGVHCDASDFIDNELASAEVLHFPPVKLTPSVWKAIENYLYSKRKKGIKSFLKHLLGR